MAKPPILAPDDGIPHRAMSNQLFSAIPSLTVALEIATMVEVWTGNADAASDKASGLADSMLDPTATVSVGGKTYTGDAGLIIGKYDKLVVEQNLNSAPASMRVSPQQTLAGGRNIMQPQKVVAAVNGWTRYDDWHGRMWSLPDLNGVNGRYPVGVNPYRCVWFDTAGPESNRGQQWWSGNQFGKTAGTTISDADWVDLIERAELRVLQTILGANTVIGVNGVRGIGPAMGLAGQQYGRLANDADFGMWEGWTGYGIGNNLSTRMTDNQFVTAANSALQAQQVGCTFQGLLYLPASGGSVTAGGAALRAAQEYEVACQLISSNGSNGGGFVFEMVLSGGATSNPWSTGELLNPLYFSFRVGGAPNGSSRLGAPLDHYWDVTTLIGAGGPRIKSGTGGWLYRRAYTHGAVLVNTSSVALTDTLDGRTYVDMFTGAAVGSSVTVPAGGHRFLYTTDPVGGGGGGTGDTTAPTVTISTPSTSTFTATPGATDQVITGTATDDTAVDHVTATNQQTGQTVTQSSFPSAPILTEAFQGSVTGGWAAVDSHTIPATGWTLENGAASTVNESNGSGNITPPNNGAVTRMSAGVSLTDVEVVTVLAFSANAPASASWQAYTYLRYVDANNYYRVQYQLLSNGVLQVQLQKSVAGVITVVTGGIWQTITGAYAANVGYSARVRLSGTSLRLRFWPSSQAEPATWDFDVTDTSITAAGDVLLGGWTGTASGVGTISWAALTLYDPTAAGGGTSVSWSLDVPIDPFAAGPNGTGSNSIKVVAYDTSGNPSTAKFRTIIASGGTDNAPPIISLQAPAAPVVKDPVRGIDLANPASAALPTGYTAAGVPALTCYLNWRDLQASQGAAIGGAGLTKLNSYLTWAQTNGGVLKLRIFCNGSWIAGARDSGAPLWLKTLVGTFRHLNSQDQDPSIDPALVLAKFWKPAAISAYDSFISQLAAVVDPNPYVRDVSISGAMMLYAEPMILDLGDTQNRAELVGGGVGWGSGTPASVGGTTIAAPGAGWSDAAYKSAMKQMIDIHATYLKNTRSSFTYNPYQRLLSQAEAGITYANNNQVWTNQDTDVVLIPNTAEMIDYAVNSLGDRAILENNSARPDYFTYDSSGNAIDLNRSLTGLLRAYVAMYDKMVSKNGPIFIQTANGNQITNTQFPDVPSAFVATMDAVVNLLYASGVEPLTPFSSGGAAMNNSAMQTYTQSLRANPVTRGLPPRATANIPNSQTSYTVQARVQDPASGIASVTINGVTAPRISGTAADGVYSLTITGITVGSHDYPVVATDVAGNTTTSTATVVRAASTDVTPPSLTALLVNPSGADVAGDVTYPSGTTSVTVHGTAADETGGSGLASVTVNGVSVSVVSGSWSRSVAVAGGSNTITVIATDNAGNTQRITRTATVSATVGVTTQLTISPLDTRRFLIDGADPYPVATDANLHYKLSNFRAVNAAFDDESGAIGSRTSPWDFMYPDTGIWDSERNVTEFLAQVPVYGAHGVRMLTVGLQGGRPVPIGQVDPAPLNVTTAWNAAGTVFGYGISGNTSGLSSSGGPQWHDRLHRILMTCAANGIAVCVVFFYKLQDSNFTNDAAVQAAIDSGVDWLCGVGNTHRSTPYPNVMIDVANEATVAYHRTILQGWSNVTSLIARAQARVASHGAVIPVSTSWLVPSGGYAAGGWDLAFQQADYIMIHGNNFSGSANVAAWQAVIAAIRSSASAPSAASKPIVTNEHGHDIPNYFQNSIDAGSSWGMLYHGNDTTPYPNTQGFQTVPANWRIDQAGTTDKQAFFNTALSLAGQANPTSGPSPGGPSLTMGNPTGDETLPNAQTSETIRGYADRAGAPIASITVNGATELLSGTKATVPMIAEAFAGSVTGGWSAIDAALISTTGWTVVSGAAANFAESGGVGSITPPQGGATQRMAAGANVYDVEQLVKVRFNGAAPATGSWQAYVSARYADANNMYRAAIQLLPSGVLQAAAQKVVAGAVTSFGAGFVTAAATYVANTFYWIRFIVDGTRIAFRIWQDGTTEPSAWQVDTTDSAITAAGDVALAATAAASSGVVTIGYDAYDAYFPNAFATSIPLSVGSNPLTVIATDTAGLTATFQATITRQAAVSDTQAPQVTFNAPVDNATLRVYLTNAQSSIVVAGTVTDNSGAVASLTVNGLATTVGSNGAFSRTISGLPTGQTTIPVVATDAAGNTYSQAITVYRAPTPAAPITRFTTADQQTVPNTTTTFAVSGVAAAPAGTVASVAVERGSDAPITATPGATTPPATILAVQLGDQSAAAGFQAYPNGVSGFAAQMGRTVDGATYLAPWDFPQSLANTWQADIAAGRQVGVLWDFPSATSFTPSQQIANGSLDTVITAKANMIKLLGGTIHLAFGYEMMGGRGGAASDYIAAYQHIRSLFTAAGVTNVRWVWCEAAPVITSAGVSGAGTWWPGDSTIDEIGTELVNLSSLSVAANLNTVVSLSQAHANKPILLMQAGVPEKAALSGAGSKAQFITDLAAYITGQPLFKWMSWNELVDSAGNDLRVETSPNSLAAFQSAVRGVTFTATLAWSATVTGLLVGANSLQATSTDNNGTVSPPSTLTVNRLATPGVPTPTSPAPTLTDITTPGAWVEGDSIRLNAGGWNGSPTAYTYRWYRGSSATPFRTTGPTAATSDTYASSAADDGQAIRGTVVASNGSGDSPPVSAAPTGTFVAPPSGAPVLLTRPTITDLG